MLHSAITGTLAGIEPGMNWTRKVVCNLAAPGGFTSLSSILLFGRKTVLPIRARVVSVFVLLAGSLLLAGCPPHVSITKLNQDPGRYAGKEITIAGRVSDSFGALGRGVFQVDDGTGTMWVLTGHYGVPGAGVKVAVSGYVEQGFSLAGRNFATILKETERRK